MNTLLGWTCIGWIVALVWALTAFDRPMTLRGTGDRGTMTPTTTEPEYDRWLVRTEKHRRQQPRPI